MLSNIFSNSENQSQKAKSAKHHHSKEIILASRPKNFHVLYFFLSFVGDYNDISNHQNNQNNN